MTVPIPTTDLALDEIQLGDISSGCAPTAKASSPSCARKRRSRSTKSRYRRPRSDSPRPGLLGADPLRRRDAGEPRSRRLSFRAERQRSATSRPRSPSGSGSMINMDAPKHTKLRLIVNRGFTPRQVAKIEENVRAQAREIVDHVVTLGGECDFVSEIAAALPLQIICDMLGIPRSDTQAHLRAHQHHPRRRRPRVRAVARRAHGRGHGAVPIRAQPRAGPTRQPAATTSPPRSCKPRSKTRTGLHKLTPERARIVLPAARRRRQRDDAQPRSATACSP